jgi:hypothetical protein
MWWWVAWGNKSGGLGSALRWEGDGEVGEAGEAGLGARACARADKRERSAPRVGTREIPAGLGDCRPDGPSVLCSGFLSLFSGRSSRVKDFPVGTGKESSGAAARGSHRNVTRCGRRSGRFFMGLGCFGLP